MRFLRVIRAELAIGSMAINLGKPCHYKGKICPPPPNTPPLRSQSRAHILGKCLWPVCSSTWQPVHGSNLEKLSQADNKNCIRARKIYINGREGDQKNKRSKRRKRPLYISTRHKFQGTGYAIFSRVYGRNIILVWFNRDHEPAAWSESRPHTFTTYFSIEDKLGSNEIMRSQLNSFLVILKEKPKHVFSSVL